MLNKDTIQLVSLDELKITEDIPETRDTIAGNSQQKAEYVYHNYNISCFADDTGLEVAALNGEPGVYSARYAGPDRDNQANIQKVLQKLEGKTDRSARFVTVITVILNGEQHQFEGIVNGHIIEAPRGEQGFGYDPIFVPEGYDKTFAEISNEEKSAISHRGRALRKLVSFLKGG
jgi:XTP/dITP diphosphohydrolase